MRQRFFSMATILLILTASSVGMADDRPAFTKSGHTTDDLSIVKTAVLKGKAVLLDVREVDEWKAGHLKLARLLPMSVVREDRLSDEQKKLLPKDQPIYCHCRSGGRVLVVSRLLRKKGYDIRPLKTGYADMVKAGFVKAK